MSKQRGPKLRRTVHNTYSIDLTIIGVVITGSTKVDMIMVSVLITSATSVVTFQNVYIFNSFFC